MRGEIRASEESGIVVLVSGVVWIQWRDTWLSLVAGLMW